MRPARFCSSAEFSTQAADRSAPVSNTKVLPGYGVNFLQRFFIHGAIFSPLEVRYGVEPSLDEAEIRLLPENFKHL